MNRWPRLTSSVVPLLAACLFLVLWLGGRKEARMAEVEFNQLRKAHGEAESRLQTLEDQNTILRKQLEANGVNPALPPPPPRSAASSSSLEAVRRLALTQQQLADTKAQLQALQLHAQQLESTTSQLQSDNTRLTTAASETRDEADSLRRLNETIEAELKSKAARADAAEALARRAQSETGEAKQQLSLTATTLRELDDVNSRRDTYLSNLQRKYRDVNDQLRSLSARLDRYRDTSSAPSFSTDLPRLQSLVQSAEEDLRQVQALNAQAQRLSKRLQPR
jgi:DNA repair exonuclease SbcCD ATPase subunit